MQTNAALATVTGSWPTCSSVQLSNRFNIFDWSKKTKKQYLNSTMLGGLYYISATVIGCFHQSKTGALGQLCFWCVSLTIEPALFWFFLFVLFFFSWKQQNRTTCKHNTGRFQCSANCSLFMHVTNIGSILKVLLHFPFCSLFDGLCQLLIESIKVFSN